LVRVVVVRNLLPPGFEVTHRRILNRRRSSPGLGNFRTDSYVIRIEKIADLVRVN